MKTFPAVPVAALLFAGLLCLPARAEVIRLSEPVAVTADAELFGAELDPDAKALSLETLLADPQAYVGTAVRLDARISEVCQKKGCFMIAAAGDKAIRISFEDYAFFVPTDTGGKTVTLTGRLIERTLTEDQAAHLREDAGSDVVQAGRAYELVAGAVRVPKS
jgi:hypothetical protein